MLCCVFARFLVELCAVSEFTGFIPLLCSFNCIYAPLYLFSIRFITEGVNFTYTTSHSLTNDWKYCIFIIGKFSDYVGRKCIVQLVQFFFSFFFYLVFHFEEFLSTSPCIRLLLYSESYSMFSYFCISTFSLFHHHIRSIYLFQ